MFEILEHLLYSIISDNNQFIDSTSSYNQKSTNDDNDNSNNDFI